MNKKIEKYKIENQNNIGFLVFDKVEHFCWKVCWLFLHTITSDQLLVGKPFSVKFDDPEELSKEVIRHTYEYYN